MITTVLLSLLQPTAQAALPDFHPSMDLEPTIYLSVPAQQTTPTAVPMRVTQNLQGEAVVRDIACHLRQGAASQALICPDVGVVPVVSRRVSRTRELRIDLSGLGLQNIMSVEESPDLEPQAATARWVDGWFWDGWVCDVEILDVQACVSLCGGVGNVDSLSAVPNPPNAPIGEEPDCDVTCSCQDGVDHGWENDPISIVTPF